MNVKRIFIHSLTVVALFLIAGSASAAWQQVWSAEFNHDGQPSQANWNYMTTGGGWGNNELQHYTGRKKNLWTANGVLHIKAIREDYQGSLYTSARINTQRKFEFQHGRVVGRIKMGKAQGMWPAFWLLGSNIDSVGWPMCGEIDIMEHINHEDQIHGTMHWDNNGWHMLTATKPIDVTKWHNYEVQWGPNEIRWYVDGVKYQTRTLTFAPRSELRNHKFFILLNVAVGGNWPGPPNPAEYPREMQVDFVRVFKWQ